MRIAMMVGLALLAANAAEATPLRLLDVNLRAPADNDVTPALQGKADQGHPSGSHAAARSHEDNVPGVSAVEFLASLGTGAVTIGGSGYLLLMLTMLDNVWLVPLIGAWVGVSLALPLLSSLVVWALDRLLPGNASYGRILLLSYAVRVPLIAVCLLASVVFPLALPGFIGLSIVLAPVFGSVAEVVAARTAPEARPGGVPVLKMAF